MTEVLRPVIHIGYHKTGTTWFQKEFYPRVENFAFVPQLRVMESFRDVSAFDFDPVAMRHSIAIDRSKPAIICDEGLCGIMRGVGTHGLQAIHNASILKDMFPDAEIVIFVRSQPNSLAAHYAEFVRGGSTLSAQKLFGNQNIQRHRLRQRLIARANLMHFEYDRLISHYDNLFGVERVHVFTFEQFRHNPLAIANIIARRFKFKVALDQVGKAENNRSYGERLLPLARMLNQFGNGGYGIDHPMIEIPGWFRLNRALLARLNRTWIAGRPSSLGKLLDPELFQILNKRFAASNHRLLKLRTLPLAELGYPL